MAFFDEIVQEITNYQSKTKLLLSCQSGIWLRMGRRNKLIAVVGLLNIRMVGEVGPQGTQNHCRRLGGYKKSLSAKLKKSSRLLGYVGGEIIISSPQ